MRALLRRLLYLPRPQGRRRISEATFRTLQVPARKGMMLRLPRVETWRLWIRMQHRPMLERQGQGILLLMRRIWEWRMWEVWRIGGTVLGRRRRRKGRLGKDQERRNWSVAERMRGKAQVPKMSKASARWANEEEMLSLRRRLVQEHGKDLTLLKPQAVGVAFASLGAMVGILLSIRRMKGQV